MVKMRKAFYKSVFSLYKKEWARLLLLIGINLVGVGVMSGLGPADQVLVASYGEKLRAANAPDIIAMSTSGHIDEETLSSLKDVKGISAYETYFTLPYEDENGDYYQYYVYDFASDRLGLPALKEGRYPEKEGEVLVEKPGNTMDEYQIGDVIHIDLSITSTQTIKIGDFGFDATIRMAKEGDFTVTGIADNAMYGDLNNFPSLLNPEVNMKGVFYFPPSFRDVDLFFKIPELLPGIGGQEIPLDGFIDQDLPDTAIAIRTESLDGYQFTDAGYKAEIGKIKDRLSSVLGPDYEFLTFEENAGAYAVEVYAQKVMALSYILSVFFMAIVALVIASTLMRLVEEERPLIACYRSIGIDSAHIAGKYASFALISIIAGALLGYFIIGEAVLAVIYTAFSTSFSMPAMTVTRSPVFGIVATIVTCLVAMLSTALVLYKSMKENPASLLLPKAPKPGRKILLERVKPIWKRLSFKMKSMFRNLFRAPLRSALTLIAVTGSTMLLFTGFGILDASLFGDTPNAEIISFVALVVVLIAGLLSVLVLTTITNISVSEKNREIATLMVLGYRDDEVALYVYREIDFLAIVGIILGLPVGIFFCLFIFSYVDFGKLSDIQWWSYLLTPILEILMMIVSNLIMLPKIKRTDMNGSLKAVE